MVESPDYSDGKIYKNLESIANSFEGILLDAYGVFWGGNAIGLFPGSKETMERLISEGKIIGILSNSTQLANNEVEKLKSHGLIEGRHFHFLITSGEVANRIFTHNELPFPTPKKKFFLSGTPHPKFCSKALFQNTPFQETSDLNEADFIYISIPHIDGKDQVDPTLFEDHVSLFKSAKIPMVCANPDRFAHEGNPPQVVVRQGSIALLHEKQGGQVFYIGKPSNFMYDAAMKTFEQFGIDNPQNVLMVGDTPETDIRGANRFNMPSALVIKSGIMAERIAHMGWKEALKTFGAEDFPNFYIDYMGEAMNFELHPNLAKKDFIVDLPLCRVLLENEFHYPWIFLVPRRTNVSRMIDLSEGEQLQLLKELDVAQNILWKSFELTQLNVAAIGNKTPQLHFHVIGRREDDPAWPHTVWDHAVRLPYSSEQKEAMISLLKTAFLETPSLSI